MKRPSRSRTDTGIVTRLVSTLIISSSPGLGVGVADGLELEPPIRTGGRSDVTTGGSFCSTGGVGVGATRGRERVSVWAIAAATVASKRESTSVIFFIRVNSGRLIAGKAGIWTSG